MRILFVSHETGYTFGVYLDILGPALAERGHEVHVLNCRPAGPAVHEDELVDGVWIHRRRHLRPRGTTRVQRAPVVRDALRLLAAPAEPAWTSPVTRLNAALTNVVEYRRLRTRFDVVEAPEHLAEGLGLALLHVCPVVVELHGPLILSVPHWGYEPGWHLRLSDRIERLGARLATATVAPSTVAADSVAQLGWSAARRARVVPHAIDVDAWSGVAPAAGTAPVVLAVGSVSRSKGADTLVRAAARLGDRVSGLEVVFVGPSVTLPDGTESVDEIAALAASLGVRCRFPGAVDRADLETWYGRARVVAVASRFDSFSLVGLEAMASARPVVCTRATGLADLADPATESITVVDVDDPAALADALLAFLVDPGRAAAAGSAARTQARRDHAPDVIAARKEVVYAEARDRWLGRRSRIAC